MAIESFAKLLQFSISPIALISAASLLLLSITNRMGRTLDRSRSLARELEEGKSKELVQKQIQILVARSRSQRFAVLSLSSSIFISCLMILGVFLQVFVGWELKLGILVLLFGDIVCICTAVVFLFLDVSASLNALQVELRPYL